MERSTIRINYLGFLTSQERYRMNIVIVENDRVFLNGSTVCHVDKILDRLGAVEIQRLEIVGHNPGLTHCYKEFLISRLRVRVSRPTKVVYQIEEVE